MTEYNEKFITDKNEILNYFNNLNNKVVEINYTSKTIILDFKNIYNIGLFYDEIQNKLTDNCVWMGRNLDAYNDVLRGGFGVFDEDELVNIVFINIRSMIEKMGTYSLFIKIMSIMISHVYEISADSYCWKYIEILKENIKEKSYYLKIFLDI